MDANTVNVDEYQEWEAVVAETQAELEAAIAAELDELQQAGEVIIAITPRQLLALEQVGYMVNLRTGALLCEP